MRALFPILLALLFISFLQKRKEIVPPGTVRINDTLFIDKTEIANIHWREYLHYLLSIKKDTIAYEKALPDTLVWDNIKWTPDTLYKNIAVLNNPYPSFYFRHPASNFYPVVGISFEQVIEFCKWRTYAANQSSYFKEKNIKDIQNHLADSFPIRFYYRLPTIKEWETCFTSGVDSSSKVFKKFSKKVTFFFQTNETIESDKKLYDSKHSVFPFAYTANVRSYFPDKRSLYNTIGNVAEMVSEKGIAKGGSFIHPLDSCRSDLNQYYTLPEMWLGFRCVAIKVF